MREWYLHILHTLSRLSLTVYSIIKYPYPKSSYCDVPSEAKTGAPMCRPLPQRYFPLPPPQPAPIRKCSMLHFF